MRDEFLFKIFPPFCVSRGVNIGHELSCCGGSDEEDYLKQGTTGFETSVSFFFTSCRCMFSKAVGI